MVASWLQPLQRLRTKIGQRQRPIQRTKWSWRPSGPPSSSHPHAFCIPTGHPRLNPPLCPYPAGLVCELVCPQRPQKLGKEPCRSHCARSMTSEASLATARFETCPCTWNAGPFWLLLAVMARWQRLVGATPVKIELTGPRASRDKTKKTDPLCLR